MESVNPGSIRKDLDIHLCLIDNKIEDGCVKISEDGYFYMNENEFKKLLIFKIL